MTTDKKRLKRRMKVYRKYRFPSETKIKSISRRLETAEGTRILPERASLSDRVKYQLCKKFVEYCLDNNLTQRQLAHQIGVDEARVSEVVHYHVHKLTIDRLVKYIEKIKLKLELKVA